MDHLIIIPGLGGKNRGLEFLSRYWSNNSLKVHVLDVGWRDGKNSFNQKLKLVTDLIDSISLKEKIYLLGTSAGGSACLNAYIDRTKRISKLINVCGRLRRGGNVYPSLDLASKTSKPFKESVLKCERNLNRLKIEDKNKILTICSYFDETVPISTMTIDGTKNVKLFSIGHVTSIFLAMTLYSNKIKSFLRS